MGYVVGCQLAYIAADFLSEKINMKQCIFENMQSAVEIVSTSEHPASKVAATLAGKDAGGADFALSRVNFRPEAIRAAIPEGREIGDASGYVHAETACVLEAPITEGASVFVTDPPCPNCVKNMAEAGISALYIDHKGFAKDWASRRGEDFRDMSLRICEKAGISVYKIFRKESRVEPILEIPPGYKPIIERPAKLEIFSAPMDNKNFLHEIERLTKQYYRRAFAVAVAGKILISAEIHPIAGFTAEVAGKREGKYTYELQPVNRILMTAARKGLRISPGFLYSSRVPTAREQVNMLGAGLSKILIGELDAARDEHSLAAMKIFQEKGIISFKGF